MDIVETIGFFISLFAFIFLMFRKAMKRGQDDSSIEEQEQNERLKEFLKSLDIDLGGEEEPVRLPPPPPPKPAPAPPQTTPQPQAAFSAYKETEAASYKQQSAYATRKLSASKAKLEQTESRYRETANDYHMIQAAKPSRGRKILFSLSSPKDMIVLHEILSRPYS